MSSGLQSLLDSKYTSCLGFGHPISASKTEVVILNGTTSDSWHIRQCGLCQSASFKQLIMEIFFLQCSGMTEAFVRLLQNVAGVLACSAARYKALMRNKPHDEAKF